MQEIARTLACVRWRTEGGQQIRTQPAEKRDRQRGQHCCRQIGPRGQLAQGETADHAQSQESQSRARLG
jgi:hypothetical protein